MLIYLGVIIVIQVVLLILNSIFKNKIIKSSYYLSIKELKDLIIKVIRMSEKREQQKTINEIKQVLRNLSEEGF